MLSIIQEVKFTSCEECAYVRTVSESNENGVRIVLWQGRKGLLKPIMIFIFDRRRS